MRIYNATNSQISLPLNASQRISIAPHAPSGDIMGREDFIKLIVTSYTTDEIAFIVSGPFELSMCAGIPVATSYIVQSLDEALKRFGDGVTAEETSEQLKEEKPKAKKGGKKTAVDDVKAEKAE